jgi:DNA-binding CsgD family transcriptional regulator
MSEIGSHDEIIEAFYSAAAGERSWEKALMTMVRAFNAWAVTLFGIDMRIGAVDFSFEAGNAPPEASIDYIRNWNQKDPRAAIMMGLPPGEWDSCHRHFSEEEVAQIPFFQDFLIPYGGRWTTGGNVYRDERTNVVLSVHRGYESGPLSDDDLAELRSLGRHFEKAIGLWFSRRSLGGRALLGLEVVQRLNQPIVVVDGARRIVGINPSAEALLARAKVLQESGGCLTLSSAKDDANFLIAVRDLCRLEQQAAQKASEQVILYAGGSGNVGRIGLCMVAVRPGATMGAFGSEPLVLALLYDSSMLVRPDGYLLATMYGLTPAETRIARLLCEGLSINEIAESSLVSVHTVRSQVKALLEKTDCNRQAELVARLSNMPSLFHG